KQFIPAIFLKRATVSVLFFTKVKITKTETDPKTLDMSTPTRWLRGLAALLFLDYIGLAVRAKGRGHYFQDLCSEINSEDICTRDRPAR
ncbi:hypothetical protein L915_21948, partial [Phytophthora nicotianae]